MKKSIVGILCVTALFILAACMNNAARTSTPVQIPTRTDPPATATTTMSAGFAALIYTEIPFSTPVLLNATPLPITGTPTLLPPGDPNFNEQEEIREVIRSYFDLRHQAFSTFRLDGFDRVISNRPDATAFWELESSKLRVELKHAELNGFRHAAYEYFLYDENIAMDLANHRASVSVSLRQNVIDEYSVLISPGEPHMSSMWGEDHTIVLLKEDGKWKIISDTYNDFLWRGFRNSGTSFVDMLQRMEAQPTRTPSCFTDVPLSMPFPEQTSTPDVTASSTPKIKAIYLNAKRYDPEWPYSFPFTNLYFEPNGESALRFTVEVDHAYSSTGQTTLGWQIVIYPHMEGEKSANKPTFVLDNLETITCESRTAFVVKTSLEEIQKELGNYRVFNYQVMDEKGDIKLEQRFYLNPPASYLMSDMFGDMRLEGGMIGYPNLMDESKAVFPRIGQAILVREPRGGFFQLHYLVRVSRLEPPSGIWMEETSDEVVIQILSYREHGLYGTDNSYLLPDDRKIRGKKNYDFEIYFTIDELKQVLGNGNEFYIRFLDRNGNVLGQDYFYFLPYSQATP
jgi:hypothetical protein